MPIKKFRVTVKLNKKKDCNKWGRWKTQDLKDFVKFLNKYHKEWYYMNVYDKDTSNFIKRYYYDNPPTTRYE